MQITTLKLLNFRNYDQLNIEFSKKCNLIYGQNGMGKTNLIEAIYVLALTKSFRDDNDKDLIKDGKNLTKISGTIDDLILNDYQVIISDAGKKVKISNNLCHKMSDYISRINVVLFNPDDLRFIKDTPSVRRKFLNIDISQFDNSYLISLSQYNKVLKQRNAYLKTMYLNGISSKDYLSILTEKLMKLGIIIYNKRKKYLDFINKYLNEYYKKITNNLSISLKYVSDYDNMSEDDLSKKYETDLERDMILNKTQFGIHHDDLLFYMNNKLLKNFGSEGQQKNAIISYKLAQIKVYKEVKNKLPILILDDLFSELDNEKINNILYLLDISIQTFITTTSIDIVSNKIKKNSKLFRIVNEKVMEVK